MEYDFIRSNKEELENRIKELKKEIMNEGMIYEYEDSEQTFELLRDLESQLKKFKNN